MLFFFSLLSPFSWSGGGDVFYFAIQICRERGREKKKLAASLAKSSLHKHRVVCFCYCDPSVFSPFLCLLLLFFSISLLFVCVYVRFLTFYDTVPRSLQVM